MQVQLRNISSNPQGIEETQSTNSQQKTEGQEVQSRIGKAIPRIMAALSTAVTFMTSTIQDYKTAIVKATQSTSVQQNEIRLQNKEIMKQMLGINQEQPFPDAVENAVKQVNEDLQGISHKDTETVSSIALENLSRSVVKLESKLTSETMTKLLTIEMKNILLKDLVVQNLKNELGTKGIPNDEGTMATLLMTKQYDMSALSHTPNSLLPKTIENLVTSMGDIATTQRNYTQAKNEIQGIYIEAMMANTDMTKQEIKQSPEFKELKTMLETYALEFEETKTTQNNGQLPAISLTDYIELFKGVAKPYLTNLGVTMTKL